MAARIRRMIVLLAGITAGITAGAALTAAPASAHTDLAESDPKAGARLDAPPAAVTLTFTESMSPRLATMTLRVGTTNLGEMDVRQGDTTIALVAAVPLDQVPTSASPQTWSVSYRVTSTDGHPVEGNLSFQTAPSPQPSNQPSDQPSEEQAGEPSGQTTSAPPSAPAEDDGAGVEQLSDSESDMKGALVVAVLAGIAIAAVIVLRARRRSRGE